MSLGAVLIGLLEVLLNVAVVILIAWCIVWACRKFIGEMDANVFYWGKVVVGLICLIIVVSWLLSLLGVVAHPILFRFTETAIVAAIG